MVIRLVIVLALCACGDTQGDIFTSIGPGADASGADGGDPCAADGPCPNAGPGEVTVCGRLLDIETSQPITDAADQDLVVAVADLANLPPQASLVEVTPDQCGWFSATVSETPVAGIAVVVVDDLAGSDYRTAGSLLTVGPGQVVRSNVYAVASATLDDWSSDVGPAADFDNGALIAVFADLERPPLGPLQGSPVDGVALTENGVTVPPSDFYFSDTDPLARTTLSSAPAATGPNGLAIFDQPTSGMSYSGQRSGCTFATVVGVGVSSIVQVQEIYGNCP